MQQICLLYSKLHEEWQGQGTNNLASLSSWRSANLTLPCAYQRTDALCSIQHETHSNLYSEYILSDEHSYSAELMLMTTRLCIAECVSVDLRPLEEIFSYIFVFMWRVPTERCFSSISSYVEVLHFAGVFISRVRHLRFCFTQILRKW